MNESEATRIIQKHDKAFHEGHADIFDSHKYGKAEGYLEAIHKVRVLEIALDGVLARFNHEADDKGIEYVTSALEQWEKKK